MKEERGKKLFIFLICLYGVLNIIMPLHLLSGDIAFGIIWYFFVAFATIILKIIGRKFESGFCETLAVMFYIMAISGAVLFFPPLIYQIVGLVFSGIFNFFYFGILCVIIELFSDWLFYGE